MTSQRKPVKKGEAAPKSDVSKIEHILHSAATRFSNQGFEKTSLDQVARDVGLHKATLYHYIDGKHDLLFRCLSRSFDEYTETLDHMDDASVPVVDRLRLFFTTLAAAQSNDFGRCLSAVGAQALAHEPGGHIRQFQRKLTATVVKLLQQGIDNGELRDVSPVTTSALVFGSFNWIWRWNNPETGVPLATVVDTFLDLLLQGILTNPLPVPPHALSELVPQNALDPSNKHHAILQSAARFFCEQGYEATSLNDIADDVGVHKATLYHYVRSKNSILSQCLEASLVGIDETEVALADQDMQAQAKFCLFLEQRMFAQNNDFGRCLNLVGPNPLKGGAADSIRAFQKRLEMMLLTVLREGQASGTFRPVRPGLTAAYVFGATNWVPHWHRPGGDTAISEIVPAFEDVFLNGILSR